jgi:hypothetical protein
MQKKQLATATLTAKPLTMTIYHSPESVQVKCKNHCHTDTPQFQLFWALERSAIKYLSSCGGKLLPSSAELCENVQVVLTLQEQKYKQVHDADELVLELA